MRRRSDSEVKVSTRLQDQINDPKNVDVGGGLDLLRPAAVTPDALAPSSWPGTGADQGISTV